MGRRLTCPSSRPEFPRSQVIGIVAASGNGDRQVEFLPKPVPVTPELRALSGPVELTEMLRFASPCAMKACAHFKDNTCGVARHVRDTKAPVTAALPECHIRDTCRWFDQEGGAACMRCPAVVTDTLVSRDGGTS